MSYRSFTRVLGGDTNLERKCRLLFGVSLLLLIVGAFWYAERLMRKLILSNTAHTLGYHVQNTLMSSHFGTLSSDSSEEANAVTDGYRRALAEFYSDAKRANHFTEVLMLSDRTSMKQGEWPKWQGDSLRVCALDDAEGQLMQVLQAELLQHIISINNLPTTNDSAANPTKPFDSAIKDVAESKPREAAIDPVHRLIPRPALGKYFYYQPVYWKASCGDCHVLNEDPAQWPLRVVKVTMPSTTITAEMNWFIAMLLTTAFVTVFLSMIALYAVVRYVIVKPLQHLRDISEEVRRGNTNLRADLQTNDEFQELGDSFNRMLRHLVDAQLELRETNRQLDGRLDQLAQANMHLFEMNRLKSDFLANMSHELRTPLNSIIGFADILQGVDSLDARHRRYATNIGRSGRSLLEIINDILDLAKLESGRMECRPSEFSIESLLQENCDMVRSLSEEKNIDLELTVAHDLPMVYQDQGKVQQIVTNLLSNAIKFTPEGGRITVSAHCPVAERLAIVVADTGIGIAEDDRNVIFEKFRQGSAVLGRDNLTREYSGTGLGLSIVKELSRLLEGEISFTSEVGKGSEFTVTLPLRWAKPARHEASLANRLEDLSRTEYLLLTALEESSREAISPERLEPINPSDEP